MAAVLERGFRPFFLLAAIHAAGGGLAWLAVLGGWWTPSIAPAFWHGREMLFGFATAVIAGFLLTAVQNWTGRRPCGPVGLLVLAALWLAARALLWVPGHGPLAAALADAGFLAALAGVLLHAIIRARNWRNLALAFVPLVLGSIQLVPVFRDGLTGTSLALTILVLVWLMAFMGGRVIPFFTERRLPQAGVVRTPGLDLALAVLLAGAVPTWAWAGPQSAVTTGILAGAGALLLLRQFYWGTHRTLGEPLLWILHVGHAWLGIGLLAIAAVAWGPVWLLPTAFHAVTIGALGSLTLGMMARVALGHTGRSLRAPRGMAVAFGAISVAALLRLAAGAAPAAADVLLPGAAVAWTAAFLIYTACYLPILIRPRVDNDLEPRLQARG